MRVDEREREKEKTRQGQKSARRNTKKNIYYVFSRVYSCGFAGAVSHTYGTNLVKLFRNREISAVPTYHPSKRRKRVSLSKDLRDFEKQGKKCVPNGPLKWGIRLHTKCSQRLHELQTIVAFLLCVYFKLVYFL